jgi:hypothetical protein
MSKIEEIRKRHQERQAGEEPADYSLAFEEAHEDRAALLAALDGEWQSERPTEGDWWVAIHPERRSDTAAGGAVVLPATFLTKPFLNRQIEIITREHFSYINPGHDVLTGALWQRRTVPGDPFKGGGK